MSQTVGRALSILEFLADEPRSLGQIADHLSVHKSTASRLLQTVEAQGFVRRDDRHIYRLGPRLLNLAFRTLAAMDVRVAAAPHLRRLGELTAQTVHLGVLDGGEVTYIDKHEGSQSVRMYSRIGKAAPLHCTGVAKAILAFRPDDERRVLAERIAYTPFTKRTITTPAAFLGELERIRTRGFAVDDREHEDFIHCVAAPIRSPEGEVSHGLSISTTTMSLSRKQLLELAPLLLETAATIEKELG
ncbi:IclR family transcriptional regulator [Blastococcus atacamensis]|uniref:IclR family transcriptional regulator n=1 Tax=Blastococcus atacamensis TaxID=2070508 RepID=UPI000CECAFE6|nr:IclR family transcriptional regulator [Blastococcus atacamensis]